MAEENPEIIFVYIDITEADEDVLHWLQFDGLFDSIKSNPFYTYFGTKPIHEKISMEQLTFAINEFKNGINCCSPTDIYYKEDLRILRESVSKSKLVVIYFGDSR